MTPITTRSTRERIIRNSLVTVMLLGYAGWSFYDGYRGYPQDNLETARQELPAEAQADAKINPAINQDNLARLQSEGILSKGQRLGDVEAELGPPSWNGPFGKGEDHAAFWFGPAGTLVVRHTSLGIITHQAQFKPGKHKAADLFIQKLMGVGIGIIGLYALARVIAMLATSVTLSDAGLKIPNGRVIPFEAMTAWDPGDYKDKGRITLTYGDEGRTRQFVLDDYKLAAFRPIVDEICTRKGFANPFDAQTPPESADTPPT
jgi:hypothetical protein